MKKNFLSILDFTKNDLFEALDLALELKEKRKNEEFPELLPKKTLGMIFEKASTRTRISFETGMFELGGHAIFLNPNDMQLGRGEAICDTAKVLSRYLSVVMMRSNSHSTVEEIADNANIPVINGLSDKEHPCQILADILTMKEIFKDDLNKLKVVWIGDGNNVCNSLILSSVLTGYEVCVSTPKGYEPDPEYIKNAQKAGGNVKYIEDPAKAAEDADVIYTDTWISMGSEAEKDSRLQAFSGYCVDENLLKNAKDGAVVMHCLPAHRGDEITDSVMDGKQSVVWQQAENRLHAQKALMVMLLGKNK
ncbi:ornithine carbamoyltransferase [Methanoplanus sp. FWC-SCC4]|uniref:Ornithine carbamoyltransferase n=1 Tax=Methanochimaera problematica TaxID=2609417 RepID=A0AA97FB59_9EURY|nr:ornithine carbamoyltransferase [Methanoplanus sp. FWC-SCC4]WOF16160.1 ornithine carbamoyltransferase [Methanoplanus sp. FWC-SCC4]